MTTTLSRPELDREPAEDPRSSGVIGRWHELRRIGGLVAVVLAVLSGILLAWPSMAVVAVLGAAAAGDATLALRTGRRSVGPTLVADITLTAIGIVVVDAPPAATGLVVAYYVLVAASLSGSIRFWAIALYAVAAGIAASAIPLATGAESSVERSLAAAVLVIGVFGVALISVVAGLARARGAATGDDGRRVEVADAVARASAALVSEDDARALASSLEAIRAAMGVTVVFVERNEQDAELGVSAVVVECAAGDLHPHPSLERATTVPWSSMPGARAHLDGGAPFFYRVEESRGTPGDRGGESALAVEVDVPIVVEGEWVGVVGAADRDGDRAWRTDDLLLLRTMADLTAAFWQRASSTKARDSLIGSLDGRLRYEEAIARASRALLGEGVGGVEPALRAVGEAVGADRVVVTGRPASTSPSSNGSEILAMWVAAGPTSIEAIVGEHASSEASERDLVASIDVAGSPIGSLVILDSRRDRSWADRDRLFARTVAEMLGAFYGRARDQARLQASLTSKDQLIASVSHELRTPLTAVGGLADELRLAGDRLTADERDELLGLISGETKDMADLVEDLLVAARSHDGAMSVFPERVDLSVLVESTLAALTVPDGVGVDVEAIETPAHADPTRVRQVVRNLLTNAFRYGGSAVSVTFGGDDSSAWVTVHDDGPGVAADDRDRVFQPYGRGASASPTKASIGLGLTVSRRLAELMGGSLRYLDGPGATFRLTVPRGDAVEG